jgi:hypothetical protein
MVVARRAVVRLRDNLDLRPKFERVARAYVANTILDVMLLMVGVFALGLPDGP